MELASKIKARMDGKMIIRQYGWMTDGWRKVDDVKGA